MARGLVEIGFVRMRNDLRIAQRACRIFSRPPFANSHTPFAKGGRGRHRRQRGDLRLRGVHPSRTASDTVKMPQGSMRWRSLRKPAASTS